MLIWFLTLALSGIVSIIQMPEVLKEILSNLGDGLS
jgi:K+ transporter